MRDLCGRNMGLQSLAASFVVLALVTGSASVATATQVLDPVPVCGDVNNSGTVTSADALNVLKQAVNPAFPLGCETCPEMVRLGNPSAFGGTTTFGVGYLLGTQVKVDSDTIVTHFGIIPNGGGASVQMALYADQAGEPGALVMSASAELTKAGFLEFPLSSARTLPAGVYWLMAVYSTTAPGLFDSSGTALVTVKYRDQAFGDPLPDPFGTATTYTGGGFNYWIKTIQP